jgi:hypothetical protein
MSNNAFIGMEGRNESGAGAFYRSSRKCGTEEGIRIDAALGRGVLIAVCS